MPEYSPRDELPKRLPNVESIGFNELIGKFRSDQLEQYIFIRYFLNSRLILDGFTVSATNTHTDTVGNDITTYKFYIVPRITSEQRRMLVLMAVQRVSKTNIPPIFTLTSSYLQRSNIPGQEDIAFLIPTSKGISQMYDSSYIINVFSGITQNGVVSWVDQKTLNPRIALEERLFPAISDFIDVPAKLVGLEFETNPVSPTIDGFCRGLFPVGTRNNLKLPPRSI